MKTITRLVPAFVLTALFLVPPGDAAPLQGHVALREDAVTARPAGPGSLELRFPVRNSTGEDVEVRWRVELRDLDGTRRGRRGGTWTAAAGDSVLAVRLGGLPEVLAPGEEARYVACWTLETDRDLHRGRRSLYRLAARPVLAAVWPETFHAGAPALLPLALADASGRPLGGRDLTVRAITGDRSVEIAVRTGPRGEALAALPPLPPGRATVRAKTRGGGWSAVIEEELEVVARTRILLSTDKPLYQPGQPVHLRALLLRRPSLRPAADEDALLEIRDAKGNKVFKEALRTNTFGVLAATFTLAGQVNMGTYTASLTAGDNVAEKAFTVDRYVLPKMKVALELDRAFYLPGQELRGTVSATYLFGKPVARAAVRATFFDYQGQWLPSTVLEGAADPEGIFHLAHRLPETLVGQPVEGGNALVLLQVDVTDAAGQVQTATRTLTVARSPLEAQLIPESGVLVPGVLNRFFVTLTDPGGAPLPGRATVTFASNPAAVRQVEVGPSGLASFTWTPPEGLPGVAATLEAEAAPGRVVASWQLGTETAEARILVRPSATLLQVGDPLTVEVLAAGAVGDAFLDVTRDGQTVAMATVPLRDGAGQHTLDLDPSMAGTLAISAWVLSPRGEYTRDSRVVWVEDPAGLQLDATLDGETYRPGETARLSLAVTDEEGRPVQAALGIQVVDEAVFALQDARPGLLKLFFRLEEELLKPSFQVGRGAGLTLGALLGAAREADAATRQASQAGAEAVVAAQGDVVLARRGASSLGEERARVSAAMADYAAILRTRLSEELGRQDPCGLWSSGDDRVAGVAARVLGRDVWGTRLRYDASGGQLSARSAGPDAAFETWDDALATLGRWDLCPMVVETAALGGWHGRWADDAPIPMAAPVAEEGFGAPMLRGARPGDGGREERRDRKASPEKDEGGAAGDAPRVRQWFPETLFVEDCLITGADGRAAVEVPLADSITTWRVSAVASDTLGRLGGGDQPLRVFQDFFVDVDFPVFLTRGDEITFPVVVYNYLEKEQTVSVDVEPASWFELLGEASHVLVLGPGEVRSVAVPVRVRDAGWHALMVTARGSGGLADAVRRTVEVRPDGREVTGVRGGSFRTDTGQDRVELPLAFPADAVPGSRKALVQILPGLTSHVVQGMESLLRLPGGCFEQTSSSAWPNVLALRYLRDTEQVTPELEMQALQYVNAGYQRILTFECPSGGFNWWQGDATGNVILTAFGMMMLRDTQAVYPAVDDGVIDRAFRFLAAQQQPDGFWGEDRHLHAGNENLGAGRLRSTCYIAWALAASGYGDDPVTRKALDGIAATAGGEEDLYTLGVCANALALTGRKGAALERILDRTARAAVREGERLHWEPGGMTLVQSGGIAAQVEVTALLALAWVAAGYHLEDVAAVVDWLAASKDPQGNWGYNTQATVLALKVFLAAARLETGSTDARVRVLLDGRELGARLFDEFNRDVLWQVEIPQEALGSARTLTLELAGTGNLGYQVVTGHHVPWGGEEAPARALDIEVSWDRKLLSVDDTVRARVRVQRNDEEARGAVLLTLGIPPGFDLLGEDLDGLRTERVIRSWESTGRQLILYLDELPLGRGVQLEYRLRARMPVKAATGGAEARLYYRADVRAVQAPGDLEVR